jgi:hypothetical protein
MLYLVRFDILLHYVKALRFFTIVLAIKTNQQDVMFAAYINKNSYLTVSG